MATFTTSSIRLFKDDEAGVVRNAFSQKFYGIDNSVGLNPANGYPSANLSSLPFNIADYELTVPGELGANLSITINTNIVTRSSGNFVTGDIGKFLYTGATINTIQPVGKIVSVDGDEATLENSNGVGYSDVKGWIATSANNIASYRASKGFYILTRVEEDGENPGSYFLASPKQLKATTPFAEIGGIPQQLNNTYIRLKRLSKIGNKGTYEETHIPATITRVNDYVTDGVPLPSTKLFKVEGDIPLWQAWFINPFGNNNKNLDKDTSYFIEMDETLPVTADNSDTPYPITYLNNYASVSFGEI
jgi:hypothetical protein